MDIKILFGKLVKVFGIIVFVLPLSFLLAGIYFWRFANFSEGLKYGIILFCVFLFPAWFLGKYLFISGLRLELKAKGYKSSKEIKEFLHQLGKSEDNFKLSDKKNKVVSKGKKHKT